MWFRTFLGSIVDVVEGVDVSKRYLYECYELQLKVWGFSRVVGLKPSLQYLWSLNVFHVPIPMLVQNLSEIVSVLRATCVQNLDHYLKVFILSIGIFNSLILRYMQDQLQAWGAQEFETQDLTPLDDFDQPLPPLVDSRVNDESSDHVASNHKCTLVSAKVMARYLLDIKKLVKDLQLITLEEHRWHFRSLYQNFMVL